MVVLQRRDPGVELQAREPVLLELVEVAQVAADQDRPGGVLAEPVDLEGDLRLELGGEQLVAGCGAEQDRAPLDRVVERDEMDLVDEAIGQAADLCLREQVPALLEGELDHRLVLGQLLMCHVPPPSVVCRSPAGHAACSMRWVKHTVQSRPVVRAQGHRRPGRRSPSSLNPAERARRAWGRPLSTRARRGSDAPAPPIRRAPRARRTRPAGRR